MKHPNDVELDKQIQQLIKQIKPITIWDKIKALKTHLILKFKKET